MLRLIGFRLIFGLIKFLLLKSYSVLMWFLATSLTAYLLGTNLFIVTEDITVFLFFVSFVLMLVSVIDRIIHKKLTDFVVLNRFSRTIHMSGNINLKRAVELRHNIGLIIGDFVAVGIPKLKKKKEYTFKTHQVILNELQKHRSFQNEKIGVGVIYEKSSLLPFIAVFNKRVRQRHLLRKENKYKVTITTR